MADSPYLFVQILPFVFYQQKNLVTVTFLVYNDFNYEQERGMADAIRRICRK